MHPVERHLLRKLLRQADRGGRSSIRVNERSAADYLRHSDPAERERIDAGLRNAQAMGAIDLDWGRGAASRDLIRIRLRDADRLADYLGEARAGTFAAEIARRLSPLLAEAPDWLRAARDQALRHWQRGQPAFRVQPEERDTAERLFRIALAVARGEQRTLDLRRFSVRLLGDSKAVERLLGRLADLLRHNPDWAELSDNDELFQALGLQKFPPAVFVKGPLLIRYGPQGRDQADNHGNSERQPSLPSAEPPGPDQPDRPRVPPSAQPDHLVDHLVDCSIDSTIDHPIDSGIDQSGPNPAEGMAVDWDLSPLRPFVALAPDAVAPDTVVPDAVAPDTVAPDTVAPDAVAAMRITRPPPYVLTIENLASFQRHVREVADDAIVLYTAGFPAPALADFIRRVDAALPEHIPFFHWGDRDPGGLRIFQAIAAACPRHPLQAHLMHQAASDPAPFTTSERALLERIATAPGPAATVARQWLDEKLGRLEQEASDPVAPTLAGGEAAVRLAIS